jgi:hypothetical protein
LSFAAMVTDFQPLLQNQNTKVVTARLSIRNKLPRPLILGYVNGSGVVTDDRGNRYVPSGDRAIQGIGIVQGNAGDPKFILQPGETSDARIEMTWNTSAQEIFGISFQMELALREIEPIAGGQMRLGREHALRFTGLGNRAAPTAPPVTAAPAAAPDPALDGCAGKAQCFSAGPFAVEASGLATSFAGNPSAYVIKTSVRIRNLTGQAVALGYQAGSVTVTDDKGVRVGMQINRTGDGATGIGEVTRTEADPPLVLAPNATVNATFTVSRFVGGQRPAGTTFSLDAVLVQLETLPSGQIRPLREFPITIAGMKLGILNRIIQAGQQ